jgi:hypothetical protein
VSLQASSTGGLLTYGLLDDVQSSGLEAPTSRDQILNFRRATESAIWRNSGLSWSPLDREKWYYVVSAGDRFSVPCELYYVITDNGEPNGNIGFIDVQYVIEFAGAAVTSLTASSSVLPPGGPPSLGGYVNLSKALVSPGRR